MNKLRVGITAFFLIWTVNANAYSGPNYVRGQITNLTSTSAGILIRIGANEVPQSCTSGLFWLAIDQSESAMISVTLLAWTLDREVVVYASGTSGYCDVGQVDPAEV